MLSFISKIFSPQPEAVVNISVTADETHKKTIYLIQKLLAEYQGQTDAFNNLLFYRQTLLEYVKQNKNYYNALCERINVIKFKARTWQLNNLKQINVQIQIDLTQRQGIFNQMIDIWTHFHIKRITQHTDNSQLSQIEKSKWIKVFLMKSFQMLINFTASLIQFIFFRAYSKYVAQTSKKVNRRIIRKDVLRNISSHRSIIYLYKQICTMIKQEKYEYKKQYLDSTMEFMKTAFKISQVNNPFKLSIKKLKQFQQQTIMFEKINQLKKLDRIVKAQCQQYNPKIYLGTEVCNQVYVFLIWSLGENLDGSLTLFEIFFCSNNEEFKKHPQSINDEQQVKRVMKLQLTQFEDQSLFFFYDYFRDISRYDLINSNLQRIFNQNRHQEIQQAQEKQHKESKQSLSSI